MPVSVYGGRYIDTSGNSSQTTSPQFGEVSFSHQAANSIATMAANLPEAVASWINHRRFENYKADYDYYKGTNPDRNKELQDAAKSLGIAVSSAEMAPTYEQDKMIDETKTPKVLTGDDLANYPVLADIIRTPDNMAQSFDDLDNLANLEKSGGIITDAYKLAEATQELNDIDFKAMDNNQKLDELDADTTLRRKELLARIALLENRNKEDPYFSFTLSNMLIDTGFDAVKSVTNPADSFGTDPIAIGALTGMALPTAGTAGAVAKYFQYATSYRAGKAVAAQTYRALSPKYGAEAAKRGAVTAGTAIAVLNLPFFGKVFSNYIVKSATSTGMLKRMGIDVAESFILGAGMGASQVAGEKIAAGEMSFTAQDVKTIAEGGVSLAALGTMMNAPGYGWAGIRALSKQSQESKLRKRNPVLFEKFVNERMKYDDGEPFSVTIGGEELANYLANLDGKEAQKIYDVFDLTPEKLQLAIDTGTGVTTTVGKFLANVDPKHVDGMAEHISTNGKLTFAQMQEVYKTEEVKFDGEELERENNPEAEMKMVKDAIEVDAEEIRNEVEAEPIYLASNLLEGKPNKEQINDLPFNLQLFGAKEAKTVAQEFIDGALSDDAMATMEAIAHKYGFSSAAELAQKILRSDTKEKAISRRKAKRINDALTELGLQDKQTELAFTDERQTVNDKNTDATAVDVARLESEARNTQRDEAVNRLEAEAEKIETVYEELNLFDEAEKYLENLPKTQTQILRERIKELKAEHKAIVKEIRDEQRAKKNERIEKEQAKATQEKAEIRAKHSEKLKEIRSKYEKIISDLRKEMKDDDQKRAAIRGTFLATEAKNRARAIMAELPINQSLDWRRLLQLANNARNRANIEFSKAINSTPEALAKKKSIPEKTDKLAPTEKSPKLTKQEHLKLAAKFRNQELVLRAMAKESVRLKSSMAVIEREIKRDVKGLQNDITNANKGKNTLTKSDEGHNALGELMEKFGLIREWQRQPSKDVNFRAFITRMDSTLGIMRIPNWILDAMDGDNRSFNDLTYGQVVDVYHSLKNIKQAANMENKMLSMEKAKTVTAVRDELIAELQSKPKRDWRKESDKMRKIRTLGFDQLNMDSIIGRLFGDNSRMHDIFIKKQWELTNDKRAWLFNQDTKVRAIWDKYSKKEMKQMNRDIYVEELGINLTKRQLMTIAMNWGNSGNREKLFPNNKEKVPIEVYGAGERWNEQNVKRALENNLDKKDWETVQAVWDLLDGMKADIVAHEKKRTGFTPRMVEAEGFTVTLKDGSKMEMKGGYYPLSKDARDEALQAKDADKDRLSDMLQHPRGLTQTNHGFTKERTNAEYSVSLDPSLLSTHINNVAQDLFFRDYVSDLIRITRKDEFNYAVKDAMGQAGFNTLKNYCGQIVGDSYGEAGLRAANEVAHYLRRGMAAGSIVYNFGVIFQNLANMPLYVGAVEGFGVREMIHGIGKYGLPFWSRDLINWREHEKFLSENLSPYMLELLRQPDATFRRLEDQSGVIGRQSNMFSEFSAHLMWMTDAFSSVPMWLEQYNRILEKTGDKVQAREAADMLIRRVNGSPNKADQSQFIRADRDFYSFTNLFMGFFNTEFNRWYREASRFIDKPITDLPRMLAFVASRCILFALSSELLMGSGPEKDESWGSWAIRKSIEYPFTLNMWTRDIVPPLIDTAMGQSAFSYRGSAIFQPANSAYNSAVSLGKLIHDPSKKRAEKFAQDLTLTGTYAMKMPKEIWALWWNAYDWLINDMNFRAGDLLRRRPSKERKDK